MEDRGSRIEKRFTRDDAILDLPSSILDLALIIVSATLARSSGLCDI
jgi:hypothetical protein